MLGHQASFGVLLGAGLRFLLNHRQSPYLLVAFTVKTTQTSGSVKVRGCFRSVNSVKYLRF
jgi:hypothetical protein